VNALALPGWAAPRYTANLAWSRGVAAQQEPSSVSEPSPHDEAQWMRQVAAGDSAAYRRLVDRYLRRIVAYAQRLLHDAAEAEDVAQETFLKLWQGAAGYEPRARLSSWLFRIAHNQCVDRLRRRRDAGPDALERQSAGDRPSGLLEQKQLAHRIDVALAELPERQRAAIALVHYEGMSQAEAAEVLDCGVEALESLVSRARRTLRSALSDLREDSP
jgi:RNA polymerase sigma-70 factor (ECF subfamily)